MELLIAVPTFESIYPDTFKSIYGLDTGDCAVLFDFVRGYDVATARNSIVQKALDAGVDAVLMVDNDVILPDDALVNLLEYPVDVCLGYYAHRDKTNTYSGKTNLCKLGEFNYTMQYTGPELAELRENGTTRIQVHGGGMGCALIRMDVFRHIRYPWYDWVNYPDRGTLSEDLYFCELCKGAKIPIYADTRVHCGHIMRRAHWCD